ncbi:hypothetical protein MYRNA_181 [Mycobacterium phage Myrna]|uniref:DUF7229 domain-containing protein n=1 Tax=Mycobacterium phage Myrna TaxID=546805 RepID=B5LJF3_9CAUD|nr:gp181 [Mycobacterium phage Myrna]ACH62150.1 hypothetical protein MYRNA_181 [Mycobacterium phage Myrna]
MQPDQETVEREDSQSPPGYRSDGVASPVQPIPRHHDGGGVSAVTETDVPQDDLRPGGSNWNPEATLQEQVTMAERVAAARESLYPSGQPTDQPDAFPVGHEDVADDADLQAFLDQVAKADAKHESPPVATAQRRGRNPHSVKRGQRRTEVKAPPPAPKLDKRDRQIEDISDEQLLADAGIVPFYSTTEAAQFFDKTNQWLYWGLRKEVNGEPVEPVFIYPDGTPIEPERVGDPREGRRRFTLPIIKAILLSNYRRGNVEPDELKKILRRIRINELGGEWREREGWKKVRGKWVHPSLLEEVNGKWVKKKGAEVDAG